MRELKFEVEGRPVGKARPRATFRCGHATIYTPKSTQAYENAVKAAAIKAMDEANMEVIDQPLQVYISAYFKPPVSWSKVKQRLAIASFAPYDKKPDADNLIKSVLDAMNGTVYSDDKLVYIVTVAKRYSDEDRVKIKVLTD